MAMVGFGLASAIIDLSPPHVIRYVHFDGSLCRRFNPRLFWIERTLTYWAVHLAYI